MHIVKSHLLLLGKHLLPLGKIFKIHFMSIKIRPMEAGKTHAGKTHAGASKEPLRIVPIAVLL